jgi:hypothetical protein
VIQGIPATPTIQDRNGGIELSTRCPEGAPIGRYRHVPIEVHRADPAHPHRRPATPATATQLAAVGASVGQFGLVTLAALGITGEFATGGIRTTLAATPARWAALTAKATVVGAVTFLAGLVATALATLAGSADLGSGTGERYSPEVAALLLGAWAVGALAAGVIALHRRDP